MDIRANAFGENLDHLGDKADQAAKKGQDWFNNETQNLENLVSQGDEDAKNKLLQLAQKYNVPVNKNMALQEIKNKVKAKLRDMR